MKERTFTQKTLINVPVAQLFDWHARNGAIQRLTPPWAPLKLIARTGRGLEKGVRVRFRMNLFKIPMIWEAEHIACEENRMFQDLQTKGPFAKWVHTHLFHAQGEDQAMMEDQVAYKLPLGFLSLPFSGHAQKELARVFDYRHRVLKLDLENRADTLPRQRIMVSGASGTIGSILVPFLRTCGHEVIRLVRNPSDRSEDAIFWDPYHNILDLEKAGPIDAVINLNGMDISRGKWTKQQKQQILDSRVVPTQVLSQKLGEMTHPPSVFISSSAIGFYGEGKDRVLTERDKPGDSFISRVCEQWEQASFKARETGIRTVQLRIGVVLTPAGGALARMVLPFGLGLGTRLSHGLQYMGWISMDDALGSVLHILGNPAIQGPVNLTAPHPVTNGEFTRTLGQVLGRPACWVLPRWAALALWGDMGRETLLTSARVVPEKLLKNGFKFEHRLFLSTGSRPLFWLLWEHLTDGLPCWQ